MAAVSVATPMKGTALSFSRLSKFGQCARQYQLSYVDPIDPALVVHNGAGMGGNAVHQVIETAEAIEAWRDEDAWADDGPWAEAFRETFAEILRDQAGDAPVRWGGRKTKDHPQGEDRQWWERKGGPLFLRRYAAIRRRDDETGARIVPDAVELEVSVDLGGSYVRGFVDLAVLATADGEIVARDWKTGTFLQPMQLAIYGWLLQVAKGWTVERGEFGYLRGSKPEQWLKTYDLRPWLPLVEGRMRDLAHQLERAKEDGVYPWNPSNLCVACTVRKGCEWGRTLEVTDA